jgi:hypothetical protein
MTGGAADEFRLLRSETEKRLPEFIGLRIEEAIELARRLNLGLRAIQSRENEWHTSDEQSNRVTVEVEGGVVTNARAE